jgi:DNA (cytosine-5)-methyltransferase 1
MSTQNQAPTVVDLFAGAGGLSEGLKKAGFTSILANEYDEMAATTFKHNHPNVPILVKDIRHLSVDEILRITRKKEAEISLVCGGPPCQGFSLAGSRMASDPRNAMFKEFVRVVNGLKPSVFLFENVSGIMSMSGGAVLKAIVQEFTEIGYNCEYQLLNAADYGVPQARPRLILIGVRAGSHIGFPQPTHSAERKLNGDLFSGQLKKHITVWDAISDLPVIYQGDGDEEMTSASNYVNAYQAERRGNRRPGLIFNHRATKHSEKIVERYAAIPEGANGAQLPEALRTKKVNVFKLDREKPARTITCNHRTDILHPVIPRGTTVREAARLQSFDDDYQFFGNLTRKAKFVTQDDQVGNAVPPLLAKAIGEHIKKSMKW